MIKNYIHEKKDEMLSRWMETLRVPSISADSAHREDCIQQAEYFRDLFEEWGFSSELFYPKNNEGLPSVFGENQQIKGRKTILFYGHYDVQPVDPLELWESPPFEPTIVQGSEGDEMRARGANDDKGQLLTFLEALRAMQELSQNGDIGFNIKILLEGEEETGSPSLGEILSSHSDSLQADVVLVSDVDMFKPDQASIMTMLRGMSAMEFTIHGPNRDLHSGLFGGFAMNPATALSRVIGKMFDENNHITIPHFYDHVKDISPAQKEQWKALEEDLMEKMHEVGLSYPSGEKNYSILEQNWSRPTLEINGLTSGYQGEGAKTIIPSWAKVKITCRLVEGQNPQFIFDQIRLFLENHLPEDCRLESQFDGGGEAYAVNEEDPFLKQAQKALSEIFGKPCLLLGCGASIPATHDLAKVTNAPIILGGWGQAKDLIHAPNESYSLSRFFKGVEGWYQILEAFKK